VYAIWETKAGKMLHVWAVIIITVASEGIVTMASETDLDQPAEHCTSAP